MGGMQDMITLIRMKYKEWKLKLALYTVLEAVAAEQKDIDYTGHL